MASSVTHQLGANSMVKSPVTPNPCLFNICFSPVDTQVIGIDFFILHTLSLLPESVATLSLSNNFILQSV